MTQSQGSSEHFLPISFSSFSLFHSHEIDSNNRYPGYRQGNDRENDQHLPDLHDRDDRQGNDQSSSSHDWSHSYHSPSRLICDIFDEMEFIVYSYPELINLKTNQILKEYHEKYELKLSSSSSSSTDGNKNGNRNDNENGHDNDNENGHDNDNERVLAPPIEQDSETISLSIPPSSTMRETPSKQNQALIPFPFVSIYDLLTESYREPFLPHHIHLLNSLKKIPLIKSGYNKKTHQMEEYIWRNHIDFLTYEQGGRLGDLNVEKGGKLTNWHVPFYGYCTSNDDPNLMNDIDLSLSRKEAKRVGCLLCEKLETLQLVRNTLVRHLKNHHRDYFSVYCSDDSTPQSSQTILSHERSIETSSKTKPMTLYWEIILKQAAFIFQDFLPFRIVCGEMMLSFSYSLNTNFVPYSERRLLDCLLYSLYAPSLLHIRKSLLHQLSSLSTSLVLTIDDCLIPNTSFISYACSVSFIDRSWARKQYFLGYISPVNEWTEIVTALNGIFSIVGDEILHTDCSTLNVSKTPQISQLVSSLQSNHCDFLSSDLMTILAKAFLASGNQLDSLVSSVENVLEQPPTLISTIQKVNSLIEFLNSNSEITTQLLSCMEGVVPVPLESVDWENLITISSRSSNHLECSHLCPTDDDWKIWSEIVSLLEPIKTVSFLLQGKSDYSLSLAWYIVDWIVCIYDQTSEWEVLSIEQNKKLARSTELLSPVVKTFRLKLITFLKEAYLTDVQKKTQPKYYESLCLATYCDPRTKNFGFFRSTNPCQPFPLDFPLLYQRDAKHFVLNEMRNEVCQLLEKYLSKDSTGPFDPENGIDTVIEKLIPSGFTDQHLALLTSSVEFEHQTGIKRKSEEETSSDLFSSIPSNLSPVTNHASPTEVSGHALTSFQLAYLRERIDDYCRTEMMTYESEPMICLPHLIRQNDPLHYWRINERKYPIISRLARRYLAIQNILLYSPALKSITARLYSKKHQMLCPGLFDAILFLHFNGVLECQIPDSVY